MDSKPATLLRCRLCGENVPASLFYDHQTEDNRLAVEYTLGVIKERHPEWTERDPVCRRCWEYYRVL